MAQRRRRVEQRRDREFGGVGVKRGEHPALGVALERDDGRLGRRALALGHRLARHHAEHEVDGQHHARVVAEGRGQPRVGIGLPRDARQLGGDGAIAAAEPLADPCRRALLAAHLGLDQQDVEGDHRRPGRRQPSDQVGHHRARPGPAAMRPEARPVDGHDRDLGVRRPRAAQSEVLVVELQLEDVEKLRRGPEEAAHHDDHRHREPERAPAAGARRRGHQSALKYFAAGWWKTSAETEASGSIMKPSVSRTPISASGRSSRQSVAWSPRSGHAG